MAARKERSTSERSARALAWTSLADLAPGLVDAATGLVDVDGGRGAVGPPGVQSDEPGS
ncbi:hypothetical protein [Nocardioides convexus]|uniref:hypothetical protein n=1 Tax=Nocardioides convexus TaxID=2712224 RepID=UPI00241836D6|nr:hypothetical protein [Nocardioides convexus]